MFVDGHINESGAPIYAAASGKVVFADTDGLYGHTVVIYHGTFTISTEGKYLYTFYGHMGNKATGDSYITVEKEDSLFAGQKIGRQGNSAW